MPVCDDLLDDAPIDFVLAAWVGGFLRCVDSAIGDVAEFEEFGFVGVEPLRFRG